MSLESSLERLMAIEALIMQTSGILTAIFIEFLQRSVQRRTDDLANVFIICLAIW
jgi:hypothetical protein